MAQEQKLVGFVKGLAQRWTTVSDLALIISPAKLKPRVTTVPYLKDFGKTVVDGLSDAAQKSKSLSNQLIESTSKHLFQPKHAPSNLSREARRSASTKSDKKTPSNGDEKSEKDVPFDETMRAAYMSSYNDVLRENSPNGELLSLRDNAVRKVEDDVEKPTKKLFLKDIHPTTDAIPPKASSTVRPVISQASIDTRTRALMTAIKKAKSDYSKLSRTEDLTNHLLQYPDAKIEAIKRGAICLLLSFVMNEETIVKNQALMTLGLLGYSFPPNAPGPRILSIDGGGTRGLVALEILRELENLTGKAPCDLFDYFIGVSTGAVVVTMLTAFKLSAEESLEFYKKTCISLFARDTLKGARRLILSHGYYDTTAWETVLRKNMGEKMMVDLSRDPRGIRLAAISTKIDEPDCLPFVFRSYGLPPGSVSHYEGSSKYKVWEAMRASSAAPGFFQECRLDNVIHQDGGILNNNPTAIGIHESRLLWPKEKLHTVVSMGTGRFRKKQEVQNQEVAKAIGLTSWRSKLTSIIASATDTEGIHTTLQDLLPPSTYFRVNPILSEDLGMDISDIKKMDILIHDSRKFVEDNPVLMRQIAEKLTAPRSSLRKANDWMRLQKDCTEFAYNV
ncbi:calcium-independent phospholipase A2-gamma-like [Paramacrobiotus metropolitanus]|uniref:calcium-independent phospholipase A2-gamma-like n=1 Tax=Paramacrobiotus metropolitanus TaxID=2943436 RepID=UPI00244599C5|nr:calcium-independent phospholipase A2-gamma-like [Paramacrobiotus metropolitanus]XP_055353719.1 calcium-independent phospholipase A2-gamma-like [Paramacrobiotus metropolitanus]